MDELFINGGAEGVFALLAGLIFVAIIIGLAFYVYLGFAYMAIGRKAKLKSPELAWIPFVGPLIIAYQASGLHWWPWLLIIGMFIPYVNVLASVAFQVMVIVWMWYLFKKIKRPGWWALLFLIPFVGLVMIGVAAWSDSK
ncbi:hypothetical protein KO361_05590 [Candidatus Woesearchaeota archaeon]|nr:hypothetical protein [Candidatus Woesearchaeota archaeon]